MARERTAEDLVQDVRQRAGMEGPQDDFCSDPEILEYLNQELAELRGHLRMNEGQPHQRLSKDISVQAGITLYDLPQDFWELLSVEAIIGGLRRMLQPFMENERAALVNGPYFASIVSPLYRIANNQIEFLPAQQTFTVTIRYVPPQPRLRLGQNPPDKVEGYNGYEIAAVYGAVASVQQKEQTDPSFYEGRKQRVLAYIDRLAAQRDAGRPERVQDVTGALNMGPFGFGWF